MTGDLEALIDHGSRHVAHPSLFCLGAVLIVVCVALMACTATLIATRRERQGVEDLAARRLAVLSSKREAQDLVASRVNLAIHRWGWIGTMAGVLLCLVSVVGR